ncbi:MAG: hypothetical protein ACNA7G_11750 [Methylobacter sp.]
MSNITLSIALLAASLFMPTVYADGTMDSALQQTQDCLKKQNCGSANTDAGKAAAQQALNAVDGNPANLQELYSISAEIMPILLQQAGGDPAKMQELMHNAQTNPEAFLNALTEALQAKIKNMAATVENSRASAQKP